MKFPVALLRGTGLSTAQHEQPDLLRLLSQKCSQPGLVELGAFTLPSCPVCAVLGDDGWLSAELRHQEKKVRENMYLGIKGEEKRPLSPLAFLLAFMLVQSKLLRFTFAFSKSFQATSSGLTRTNEEVGPDGILSSGAQEGLKGSCPCWQSSSLHCARCQTLIAEVWTWQSSFLQ